jgi:methyl-accepting chemotaxis protein
MRSKKERKPRKAKKSKSNRKSLFDNMTVGQKLTGGFLSVAVITLIVGALGVYNSFTLSQKLSDLGNTEIHNVQDLAVLNFQRIILQAREVEVYQTRGRFDRVNRMTQIIGSQNNAWQAMDISWDALSARGGKNERERELIERLTQYYQSLKNAYQDMNPIMTGIQNEFATDAELEDLYYRYGRIQVNTVVPRSDLFGETLLSLIAENAAGTEQIIQDNSFESRIQIITCAVFMVLGVLFAIILGMRISRAITQPVKKTVGMLKEVSEGDLTQNLDVRNKDEIGDMIRLLNMTITSIKTLIVVIKEETMSLLQLGEDLALDMAGTSAAITEITTDIKQLKEQTVNQSDCIDSTTSTIDQMSRNIDNLSGDINQQALSIAGSSSAIEEMIANVSSVTKTLVKNAENVKVLSVASENGRTSLQAVSVNIQDIAKKSEGLMEINSVISRIASQTNLLSMNAAIEAAHAGEAGKGFSVVADEIRSLAESSAEQARMVSKALKEIKESIDTMSKSTKTVLEKFADIDKGVRIVTDQEENIRNAMEEQGIGSQQILQSISELGEITQRVKNGSAEMISGSRHIIQEEKNLTLTTQKITESMNRMAAGTEQIDLAISRVTEASEKNKDTIHMLVKGISKFRID